MMQVNNSVFVVLGYAHQDGVAKNLIAPPRAVFSSQEEAQAHASDLNNHTNVAAYQVKTLAEYYVMIAECVSKQSYSVFDRNMLLLEV